MMRQFEGVDELRFKDGEEIKIIKNDKNKYWIKSDLVYVYHRLYGMLYDKFHVVLA